MQENNQQFLNLCDYMQFLYSKSLDVHVNFFQSWAFFQYILLLQIVLGRGLHDGIVFNPQT